MVDQNRAFLDFIMGKERNKPLKQIRSSRDHYSDPNVCKPFLICFCFNQLFSNPSQENTCSKRHDNHLKNMFLADVNRGQRQLQYVEQCITIIQKKLQEVDSKIRRNRANVDSRTNTADRPRQINDHLAVLDTEIDRFTQQAQNFGAQGKFTQSQRAFQQVQKLKQRKRQIQQNTIDFSTQNKQQRICQICGAIQTINDTDKRLAMHIQGKTHQGILKYRHQLQRLKQRKLKLQQLNENQKQKLKQKKEQKENKVQTEGGKQVQRVKEKEKEKEKEKDKDKDKDKEKEKDKDKQKEKDKDKDKEREREKDRQRERDRDRDRDRDKDRDREKDREKERQRQRDRDRQKRMRSKSRQNHKVRERSREHKKQKGEKEEYRRRDERQEKHRRKQVSYKKQGYNKTEKGEVEQFGIESIEAQQIEQRFQ